MASQMFCHFLDLDNAALDTFTNKSAERVAHINEQLHHLDQHISNLIELRSALLHRSNQLTSPIYIIPHGVLSYIFCFANELEQSITQPQKAMVLSAVSRRWRQVALSTPKLWERVECRCTGELHRNTSLLIQHCALYASSLDISLFNQSDPDSTEENFDTITTVLYSSNKATWEPEVMREFKEFVANRQMEVTVRGRKAELEDKLLTSPRLE